MKKLTIIAIFIFIMFFSCKIIAQQMGSLRSGYKLSFQTKINKIISDPLNGQYEIGNGCDFETIQDAFDKLSADGISGYVQLVLVDSTYTAPSDSLGFFLHGPIPGVNQNNEVRMLAYGDVTIKGNGASVFTFLNTSHFILEGETTFDRRKVSQSSAMGSITIHNTQLNTEFKWNDCIDFLDNSDHNTVQNTTLITEDYARGGAGVAFWTFQKNSDATPDSNLIRNVFIKKGMIYIGSNYSLEEIPSPQIFEECLSD